MPKQKSLAKNLTLLTGVTIALFVAVIPLGYFLSSYQYMAGDIQTESEFYAESISNVIIRNPEMWEYEYIRLIEIISKRQKINYDEKVRILKTDGTAVVQIEGEPRQPVIKRQAVIYDTGLPICTIEIIRSLVPLFGRTFFIGLAGLAIGTIIFYVVTSVPLRALYKAEEEVHASEERFRAVVQTAADAIISSDTSGNIISWNNGAQNIFGYSEEEVLGKPITILMPERCRYAHTTVIEQLQSGGEPQIIGKAREIEGIKKGGSEFPMEVSLARWVREKGVFYTTIIRDITERKRFEEEREILILELRDALANIKTLNEMLPICSHCKKIRDDKGYWLGVETYISKHTDTVFSHGMCPECTEKAMKEFEEFKKKSGH